MPGGGGKAVLEGVVQHSPSVRFLALSVSDAAEDVIAVIRAGACGYVTKNISGPELIEAVRRVACGGAVFSRHLAGFVLDAFRQESTETARLASFDPKLDQLTPREREVLRLIARGYAYIGDRSRTEDLRKDGREPRVRRASQVAALESIPTDQLGL